MGAGQFWYVEVMLRDFDLILLLAGCRFGCAARRVSSLSCGINQYTGVAIQRVLHHIPNLGRSRHAARNHRVEGTSGTVRGAKIAAPDGDVVEPELLHHLTAEPHAPFAAIAERDPDVAPDDRQRQTRQAGAAAEVHRLRAADELSRGNAVQDVTLEKAGDILPRDEIEGFVPFADERCKLRELLDLQRFERKAQRLGACRQHRFVRQSAASFLACTSNSDNAAGVMPGIRDAFASVAGLLCESFCFNSFDKPSMTA